MSEKLTKEELLKWLDDRRKQYESRLHSLYPEHMHKRLLENYDEADQCLGEIVEWAYARGIPQQQKPKVSREWIKKWASLWNDNFYDHKSSKHVEPHIEKMLEEIDVEIVDKDGRK